MSAYTDLRKTGDTRSKDKFTTWETLKLEYTFWKRYKETGNTSWRNRCTANAECTSCIFMRMLSTECYRIAGCSTRRDHICYTSGIRLARYMLVAYLRNKYNGSNCTL